MNTLPRERQIINGRTFSQSFSRATYDPVEHHKNISNAERIGGVCLAIMLGIAGAAFLIHWSAQ
jgi:hypothetical protein